MAGMTRARAGDQIMIVSHEKMMPGHLLEYRCPKFGIVFQWRVLGIYLGGEGQEGLIEVEAIHRKPGTDNGGRPMKTVMVPEPMTRGMTVIAPGVVPAAAPSALPGRYAVPADRIGDA